MQANQHFHGIAVGARSFINQQYSEPKEQEAAFDGLTLALLAVSRFSDIEELAQRLETSANEMQESARRQA